MFKIFFLICLTIDLSQCQMLINKRATKKLDENLFEPFKLEKVNEYFNLFKTVSGIKI